MERRKLAVEQERALGEMEEVKRELLALPNVLAVGFGIKETAGDFTGEPSFRVYVSHKVDDAVLGAAAIPKTIRGFKTDVLTPLRVRQALDVCGSERQTLSKHRPLQAGIAISTDANSYGTLGWFGTLNVGGTPILLTNKHVLYEAVAGITTEVKKTAQPQLGRVSSCCCCECGSDNVIGESIIGIDDTIPVLTGTSVDVAIARINADVAAELLLEITNDATDEVLTVSGKAEAVVGERVRKIGARSAFTRGTVAHVGDIVTEEPDDPGAPGTKISIRVGQIIIIPADDETYEVRDNGNCKRAFANNGDSGSVVLNDDDKIVGLLWSIDSDDYTIKIGVASHIQNVLDALSNNAYPITLSETPDGGARKLARSAALPAVLNPDPGWFERARELNRESLLAWLVERHRDEVLELVNSKRAVTVAWQRNKGPMFVAALARSGRVARYRVPFEIEGVSREQLLQAMEPVLLKHGSEALQRDLARHRDDAYACVQRGATVEDFANDLKARGLIDVIPEQMTRKAS